MPNKVGLVVFCNKYPCEDLHLYSWDAYHRHMREDHPKSKKVNQNVSTNDNGTKAG